MTDGEFARFDDRGEADDGAARLLLDRLQRLVDAVSSLPAVPGPAATVDDRGRPDGAIEHVEHSLDALDDYVEGAAADAIAHLQTAAGEVVEALTGEGDAVREADEAVASRGSEARGSVASLVERLRADEEAVDGAQGEAQGAVQALAADAREEHPGATRDVFERAGEALSERCAGAVDEGFDALEQHADRSFEALHESVQESSDGWSRAVGHLLAESGEEVTRALLRELREGTDELLREGVQAFVEELAEQAVSMAAGASTTAALGPLLPQLVAAKHALHAANWVAERLGID